MAEETEQEWLARFNRVIRNEDVQEFEQVIQAGGLFPKVWWRPLGIDFMATCEVPTAKRRRAIQAVGLTRAEALSRLHSAVLEYQYPTSAEPWKKRMWKFLRHEDALAARE